MYIWRYVICIWLSHTFIRRLQYLFTRWPPSIDISSCDFIRLCLLLYVLIGLGFNGMLYSRVVSLPGHRVSINHSNCSQNVSFKALLLCWDYLIFPSSISRPGGFCIHGYLLSVYTMAIVASVFCVNVHPIVHQSVPQLSYSVLSFYSTRFRMYHLHSELTLVQLIILRLHQSLPWSGVLHHGCWVVSAFLILTMGRSLLCSIHLCLLVHEYNYGIWRTLFILSTH